WKEPFCVSGCSISLPAGEHSIQSVESLVQLLLCMHSRRVESPIWHDIQPFLQRVLKMVAVANRELFGSCTNIGECEAVCPKLIKLEVIARMNRDFIRASWSRRA